MCVMPIIRDVYKRQNMHNAVTGANEADVHYKNVNPQRDFDKDAIIVTDLRMVKAVSYTHLDVYKRQVIGCDIFSHLYDR